MSTEAVQLHAVKVTDSASSSASQLETRIVPTDFGNVTVTIQGKKSNLPIITYHDVGMNHQFCFDIFLNHPKIKWIQEHFCLYHIDAPGHEDGALDIENFPSLENLALQVKSLVQHFEFKSLICIGVGAGANILSRYVSSHSDEKVLAFVAITCSAFQASWGEWMQLQTLRASTSVFGINSGLQDFFIKNFFSSKTIEVNLDLLTSFREQFKNLNMNNVWKFLEKTYQRDDITSRLGAINCSCILFTGSESPLLDDVWEMSAAIPSKHCSRMKIEGFGSLVHVESPDQLAQPLALFFQGAGFFLHEVVPLELKPDSAETDPL